MRVIVMLALMAGVGRVCAMSADQLQVPLLTGPGLKPGAEMATAVAPPKENTGMSPVVQSFKSVTPKTRDVSPKRVVKRVLPPGESNFCAELKSP